MSHRVLNSPWSERKSSRAAAISASSKMVSAACLGPDKAAGGGGASGGGGGAAPGIMSGPAPWIIGSEEHTSELQSLLRISYAVFCLKTKPKEHTSQFQTLIPI